MNMDTGCWGQHVMAKHRNYFDATFAVHSTLVMHISSIISTMVSYTSANGYPFIYSSSLYKGMGVISDSMSALFFTQILFRDLGLFNSKIGHKIR